MWLISVTEHVARMRDAALAMASDPAWVRSVDLLGRIDWRLLEMRGYMAKAMPGVEVH